MKKLSCPKCLDNISFITFLKAPSPWHIKCDHCQAKLKVDDGIGSTIAATIIVIFAILLGFINYHYNLTLTHIVIILISIGTLAEILFYFLARTLGFHLEIKK